MVSKLIHAMLLILVILAPLPLGSNREWSWTLCALLAAAIGVAWVLNALPGKQQVVLSHQVSLRCEPKRTAIIGVRLFQSIPFSSPIPRLIQVN